MKLAKQFYHLFTNDGFTINDSKLSIDTFLDYLIGSKSSLLNYGNNYHLLDDVPIDLFISMKDSLIKPQDVIMHYKLLSKHHPNLVKVKLFEGFGHIDFTYASHHILID